MNYRKNVLTFFVLFGFVLSGFVLSGGCGDNLGEFDDGHDKAQNAANVDQLATATVPVVSDDQTVIIAASWDDALAGRHQTSYQVGEISDLVFAPKVPVSEEGKMAQLDIFAPGGGLLTRYRVRVKDSRADFVVPVSGGALSATRLIGSFGAVVTIDEVVIADGAFEFMGAAPPTTSSTTPIGIVGESL